MKHPRVIRPDFFTNPKIKKLSSQAKVLYLGVWTILDSNGLVDSDPEMLHASFFNHNDKYDFLRVNSFLNELVDAGLLAFIMVEDTLVLYCPDFCVHQGSGVDRPTVIPSILGSKFQHIDYQ